MKLLYRFLALLIIVFCLTTCKKDGSDKITCAIPAIVPYQPYESPVWHPNGLLLGFNHQPLSGVFENGTPPCTWFMNGVKTDSVGFYIMYKDGTGFKRVTNFTLGAPAWSPDGNWLAFSLGSNIFRMRFNGSTFDTSQIIQLTNSGGNFFPSWTANSDSIYYDSNNNAPAGTSFYSIWKMANNGNGKIQLSSTAGAIYGRQPFVGSDNRVYYVGLQAEVFSMAKDGSNKVQLTFNSGGTRNPRFWNNKFFFENGGVSSVLSNGSFIQLAKPCATYNISINGEIVFSKWDYSITNLNNQAGTLWIMSADGNNKKQLTFNNY